jgi:hypothetical protein
MFLRNRYRLEGLAFKALWQAAATGDRMTEVGFWCNPVWNIAAVGRGFPGAG